MKDLIIGLVLGFVFGVVIYFLGDGQINMSARASAVAQQAKTQTQLDMLAKLCPDVLKKVQTEEVKK